MCPKRHKTFVFRTVPHLLMTRSDRAAPECYLPSFLILSTEFGIVFSNIQNLELLIHRAVSLPSSTQKLKKMSLRYSLLFFQFSRIKIALAQKHCLLFWHDTTVPLSYFTSMYVYQLYMSVSCVLDCEPRIVHGKQHQTQAGKFRTQRWLSNYSGLFFLLYQIKLIFHMFLLYVFYKGMIFFDFMI